MSEERLVSVHGRVLYVNGDRSVKLSTPLGADFVPMSVIRDSDPPKDELQAGDDVTIEIPYWAARARGWV